MTQLSDKRGDVPPHPLLPEDIVDRYRSEGHWRDESLASLVADLAADAPERLALTGGRNLSYAALELVSRRLSAFLDRRGSGPGRPVVAVLPYDWRAVVTAVASSLLGAPLAGLANDQPPERVAKVIGRIDPAAVIIDVALLEGPAARDWESVLAAFDGVVAVAGQSERVRAASGVDFDSVLDQGEPFARIQPHAGSGSVMLPSGGTTGEPKLILQHDNSLIYSCRETVRAARITADDVYLGVGPFGHIMTTFATYIAFVAGAALAPCPDWRRGQVAADLAERTGATVSMMTSTHAYDLLALPEGATSQLRTVTRIMSAGKPDKFFSRLEERYGLKMMRLYGLSEVGTHVIAALDDEGADDSDGLPLPGTEVRVVDPDTGLPLAPGSIGELQTRGPSMCLGYHGGFEVRDSLTEDGFWRTGDLATLDQSGHVRISGRLKDSIRRGGININPEEMEALLFRHPSVFEGCLVGSPDERLGQLVNVVVVLRDGHSLTLDEARRYLENNGIPRRELPDRLYVVDHIPRTDLGRLSKRLLAAKIPALAP